MSFDPSGRYLLTVSHAGRGVFSLGSWERVARDSELAYPVDGYAVVIGPMEGLVVQIIEHNYDTGELHFVSPDRRYKFEYEGGTISIIDGCHPTISSCRRSRFRRARGLAGALVRFNFWHIQSHALSTGHHPKTIFRRVFGCVLGFASFRLFWHVALIHQAAAALILVAIACLAPY